MFPRLTFENLYNDLNTMNLAYLLSVIVLEMFQNGKKHKDEAAVVQQMKPKQREMLAHIDTQHPTDNGGNLCC